MSMRKYEEDEEEEWKRELQYSRRYHVLNNDNDTCISKLDFDGILKRSSAESEKIEFCIKVWVSRHSIFECIRANCYVPHEMPNLYFLERS